MVQLSTIGHGSRRLPTQCARSNCIAAPHARYIDGHARAWQALPSNKHTACTGQAVRRQLPACARSCARRALPVECPNAQPGSSNADVEPQIQTNIQKRKGVAVDDGNHDDLDEVEWDEICKIVYSYAEGNGSGDDDDDGVSDESNGLFDSKLEGDDGEGEDSETDSNVDGCGGEDSGQEEVESSDSEDTTSDDNDDAYTFISDKQKRLIPAFKYMFPGADNRFYGRYLHGNMKTAGFRGLAFKKGLWKATKATTVSEFNYRMEELAKLDPKVVDWLSDKPPAHWSRSHFNCFPKCDMLLNNICETFNSNILEAREKPIMTILEWIREWIMIRLSELRDRARKKWQDKKICPKIRKVVEKNIDKVVDGIPIKSDDWHYEVSCYDGVGYVVNLQNHTCTCRKWDLTGIPCNHGMSAICSQSLKPKDFVNSCYSVATFIEVYKHAILPVNGPKLWEKAEFLPSLPPNFGNGVGRPARARRLEHDEPQNKAKKRTRGQKNQTTKLKKQPYKVMCYYCGETGHNQKECARKTMGHPVEPSVAEQPRKMAARKKTSTTKHPTVIAEKAPKNLQVNKCSTSLHNAQQ
ncbi:hypothetical protein Sango_0368900 [Sesamum angolense]|uniref:Uncharacterized protein n=1 Tax=Sesamum angolense TaxID=2727404 RepID=A0AAE1XAP9_9LAMI|nr:hypothetical protein Sango_0368900 [Sesamum angolense]